MKQLFRLFVLAALLLGTLSPTVTHTVQAQTISSDTDFTDNSLALTREQVQSFDCTTVTDIPLGECQALVALYNSTNGAGWTDNTNWLVTTTAGNWFGVTISSGHVQMVDLYRNQLTGSIPPELGNLTNLQQLELGKNQLTGNIPPELGNLTNLMNLYLYSNQLTGNIPLELVNITYLVRLELDGNQLTGSIPPALGNLTNLYEIHLGTNQLTGSIPPELGNLTNLIYLGLNNNQLTGSIPPELGNLTYLEGLDLGGNQLTGSIPPELGNLTYLGYLELDNNQLTGSIPPELGNLTYLGYLELDNNQLTGSIPPELGNLTNLQRLYLDDNQFTGEVPASFVNLVALGDGQLGLDFNFITVPSDYPNPSNPLHVFLAQKDPDWHLRQYSPFTSCASEVEIPLAECEALVAFYNSTNGAEWEDNANWLVMFPISSWDGVTVENGHVVRLDLRLNNLTGAIPPELGSLTNLQRLYLDDNQLTGSIPPELGNLTNLIYLELYNNQLTGSIPPELGNLTALRYLRSNGNQLTGSIPPELGNMINLDGLWLYNNQLTGSIPTELGNLTNLYYLYLNDNQLTGTIPPELGSLTNLQYLYLDNNQLTGSIPTELGNLTNLYYLYLNDNQLTGAIPPELGNLAYLGYLNLGGNQLTGSIPPELGNLIWLNTLALDNNQLSGEVPASFVNLVNLYDAGTWYGDDGLYLDYNALTVPGGYPVAGNPLHDFLLSKDPNWHLRQTIEEVIGSGGGEMTSLDDMVNIVVPPGAVDDNTTFTFTPQRDPNFNIGKLAFAHNSFQLTAMDGLGNPVTVFAQPVSVTITYDEAMLGLPEESLKLYYWDTTTSTWLDAVTTCDPVGEYTRDLEGNTFSLEICHLSEFAVLSDAPRIFLPTVLR